MMTMHAQASCRECLACLLEVQLFFYCRQPLFCSPSYSSDVCQNVVQAVTLQFVVQMLKHLQSFDALTRASKHVMADDSFAAMVDAQFKQLVASLHRMSIEVPEAGDVMAAINDIAFISKSQKETLANVIAAMLQKNAGTPVATNSSKTVMPTFNNFALTSLQKQLRCRSILMTAWLPLHCKEIWFSIGAF